MRRLIVLLTFALFFFTLFARSSFAQSDTGQQYASCDACGLCKVTQEDASSSYVVKDGYIVPGNWEACRQCLYPNSTNANQPETKQTLLIDATGRAPTPQPGRFYTMVGCISTNLSSFQQSGAAASVVQTLLTMLFSVAGGITFIYLIYGAFVLVTSQNDPERLNLGRRVMVGSIVGLLISLFAVFIVNFLATNVLQLPFFNPQ